MNTSPKGEGPVGGGAPSQEMPVKPTASFDERIAQLSPAKRALLQLKLRQKGGVPQGRQGKTSQTFTAPMSYAQQRLWFLDQLQPGGYSYNVPRALQLNGVLDAAALSRVLQEIVRRHESLRTTFAAPNGIPHQIISARAAVECPLVNLSALPVDARDLAIKQSIREEAFGGFDLGAGPLLRAKLLRISPQAHILLLNMHHIVSDAWSKGVLYREIGTLYNAFCRGEKSPLPDLPSQYADFARWQQQWLQSDECRRDLDYWRERLAGDIPALELPTDFPRPAVLSTDGAFEQFSLSPKLSEAVSEFGRSRQCTPFMTLLAAFLVLLQRYSGQDDFVVGSLIANRNRLETENLIGVFINDLALHADVSGDPTFIRLLERVRETALGAYAHQDVPFEKLLEELQPGRDLSRNPIFQVMFSLQTDDSKGLEMDGLQVRSLPVDRVTALVDLSVSVIDRDGVFSGVFEYSTDLFSRQRILRMIEHYQILLESAVATPDRPISELQILSSAEKQRIVVEWNQTDRAYPLHRCFHELFEEWVARTPDATAVKSDEESLTYDRLNRGANRVASYLAAQNVSSEDVVAVLGNRSSAFLVAMLGIFKAGAAYLPLDPFHPAERLAQVIRQSRARIVITVGATPAALAMALESLESSSLPQIVRVEELCQQGSESNPSAGVQPGNLAYVIFTSGSTGTPKGAMVEHIGMLNHLFAKVDELQLSASDTVAQTASQSFDISVWQFLSALLVGGQVRVFNDDVTHDPRALLSAIPGVTILELVPSMLRAMLEEQGAERSSLAALRWMILTGEALPPELVNRWLAVYPEIPLLNAYGPTECSDDVTHHVISTPLPTKATSVPIGRAIPNARLYILDRGLKPVPVGVIGHLYVGGLVVGRGYLNDSARTGEAFLHDPFSSDTSARFYRTGDRARYLADGAIEFLGRVDYQIKLRGFRIELEEIDAVMNAHPSIRQAVSAVVEDVRGGQALVAYLVPARGQDTTPDELRHFLQERLPEYMVPSTFVKLESMPLTSSGKVNRRALSKIAIVPAESSRSSEDLTPVQEMLAGIWCEVLGRERVGIHDNFFQLGGHSLLGVRVIARVRDALKVELSVRAIFENSTIACMANRIEAGRDQARPLSPLRQVSRGAPLPLSAAQQRLWFLEQIERGNSSYNTYRVMRLRGALHVEALQRSFEQLIARHESLRTSFVAPDGKAVAIIAEKAPFELRTVDLTALQPSLVEAEAMRVAAEEVSRPFDLGSAPLLRACLIHLGKGEYILTTTLHHIISDAWSAGIVSRELTQLYNSIVAGEQCALPPLAFQYADFAAWQSDWLSGQSLDEMLDYWKRRLSGAPPLLEMPTDYPRPQARTYHGRRHGVAISRPTLEGLRHLSRENGVTLFMTLLASFQSLLSIWSRQKTIVLGSPVAGRNRSELEPIVGFFLNTLIFRSDFSDDNTFVQLLQSTREHALAAYAHQDLPFDRMVEELHSARTLSYNPIFQVWFVLHSAPKSELRLKDVAVSTVDVESGFVRHDLSLSISESDEQLWCSFDYRSDLFREQSIVHLGEMWQELLRRVAAAPAVQFSELRQQLNDFAEQRQALQHDRVEESALARLGASRRKKVHSEVGG